MFLYSCSVGLESEKKGGKNSRKKAAEWCRNENNQGRGSEFNVSVVCQFFFFFLQSSDQWKIQIKTLFPHWQVVFSFLQVSMIENLEIHENWNLKKKLQVSWCWTVCRSLTNCDSKFQPLTTTNPSGAPTLLKSIGVFSIAKV